MAEKSRRMTFASRPGREPLTKWPSDRGVGGILRLNPSSSRRCSPSAAAGAIHERGEREGGCWEPRMMGDAAGNRRDGAPPASARSRQAYALIADRLVSLLGLNASGSHWVKT
jgi:hypothetical protein